MSTRERNSLQVSTIPTNTMMTSMSTGEIALCVCVCVCVCFVACVVALYTVPSGDAYFPLGCVSVL